MPSLVTSAKVFVSSPSDVGEERIAVIRAVERVNRLPHVREKYVLQPFRYEEIAPQIGDEPQVVVDRACEVGECYFVICLLWQRMGTPFVHPVSQERFLSGTHYEFISAFRAREESDGRYPHVLLYRKLAGNSDDFDSGQAKLVDNFFGSLEGENAEIKALYSGFESVDQFENEIFQHLLEILHSNPPKSEPECDLPKIVEEDRRLDVAVPMTASVQDVVEVWVKVSLSDSVGLKQELPDQPEFAGAPAKDDAREKFMAVAFEKDSKTEKLLPLPTEVSVRTTDFEVLDDRRNIELVPGRDSATLVFALRPLAVTSAAIIQITVRTKSMHSEHWIENSSMVRRVKLTGSSSDVQPQTPAITSTKMDEAVTSDEPGKPTDCSVNASQSMPPSSSAPVFSPDSGVSGKTRSSNLLKVAAIVLPVLLLGFFVASSFWIQAPKVALHPVNQRSSIEFAVEEIREMKTGFQSRVSDYTAVLVKKERIAGELGDRDIVKLKVNPAANDLDSLRLYTRHNARAIRGQEQIWSPEYDGRVAFHERGGALPIRTRYVDPAGFISMRSNLYPITEWGIEKMIDRLQIKLATIEDFSNYAVHRKDGAVNGKEVEIVTIEAKQNHAAPKFYRLKYYIDKEYGFATGYELFDKPDKENAHPSLLEQYFYSDVKTNVGLTDLDFDVTNPEYAFPK